MSIIEMIQSLEKDSVKQDFIVCYIEMYEVIHDLPTMKQFEIVSKTLAISYKSITESYKSITDKTKIPKKVMRLAITQTKYAPKEFIKMWKDGSIKLAGCAIGKLQVS